MSTIHIARQIHATMMSAKHIFLIPHAHPDGDALGSVAACMQYLRRAGIAHTAFCSTDITPRLRFLPHTDYITTMPHAWEQEQPDVVMVFDSGDLRYAGVDTHIHGLRARPTIINIDHHRTNEKFGDHNLVLPQASSTTEVLYSFFKNNDITIDADMATCLLTGLMTDTDNFTNAATGKQSLAIGAELMTRGADVKRIRGRVFQDQSISALRLWGIVLSRLNKHEPIDLVSTYVTLADLSAHGVSENEAEGLANFLNNLNDGRAALILKELPDGQVKGSFRTTKNDVDVSRWAKALGGGGHQKSAGFTVAGPVAAALQRVLEIIRGS